MFPCQVTAKLCLIQELVSNFVDSYTIGTSQECKDFALFTQTCKTTDHMLALPIYGLDLQEYL